MIKHRNLSRQRGISLVEVLVAILLLALGLIAVALLQTSALQNNNVSGQYTLAAAAAQGLSEAMRANKPGVLANRYDLSAGDAPANPDTNCSEETCNVDARAQWDLARVYSSLTTGSSYTTIPDAPTGMLPGAQLQVACADAPCLDTSPRVLSIYWDADRTGATGYGCDPAAVGDLKCFRLVHIP